MNLDISNYKKIKYISAFFNFTNDETFLCLESHRLIRTKNKKQFAIFFRKIHDQKRN